jgi:hypothetical protein
MVAEVPTVQKTSHASASLMRDRAAARYDEARPDPDNEDAVGIVLTVERHGPVSASDVSAEYTMPVKRASSESLRLRRFSQLLPARFRHLDAVMPGSRFDIREGEFSVAIGSVANLVEAREGVSHVPRVGERFLTLTWKRICRVR